MKSPPGPPMTLGNEANAKVRLIVWCKACGHQVEPDPGEIACQCGVGTSVLYWRERLVCSECGGRQVDTIRGSQPARSSAGCRSALLLRNRWFADSPLEEDGFEPVWGFSCQVVVSGFMASFLFGGVSR